MKFNYGKIFLLGFGFFGVSVIWGVYNAFVPIFLAEKFGLAPHIIGFFMTLDNIAALLIQPPVGAWSDRLRTRFGRRIPFILIGAPITALAFGLIPLAAALPLFVACTSTLLLSAALWRTPVVALMPDITPSAKRSQANGIINFMGGIGTIIALQTGGMLYKLSPNFPFWLGSALVIVAALIVFLFVKEPTEYEQAEKQPGMFESLRNELKSEDKSALRLFLAIFFWFIGFSAVETFFTLYAKNYLGINEGDGATLLSVFPLFFVLFAIPAGWIATRIGRRTAIAIGWDSARGRWRAHVDHRRADAHPRRHRLGLCQYQLPAHGGGPGRPGARRHVHRSLLLILHLLGHCWTERQRLGHQTIGRQLQHHYVDRAVLHADRARAHARRQTRRGPRSCKLKVEG
jgi:maltose/moltooligosaccharide transporter